MSHTSKTKDSPLMLSTSGIAFSDDESVDSEPNHDIVPEILESIRGWNPPVLTGTRSIHSPRIDPLDLFFDRHIRLQLQLKRVRASSTLLADLCSLWPSKLEQIGDASLPAHVRGDELGKPYHLESDLVADRTVSLCNFYQEQMASCAQVVASTLLHPEVKWHSFMRWGRGGGHSEYEWRKTIQDSYGIQLVPSNEQAASLNEALRTRLSTAEKEAFQRFNRTGEHAMGVWIVLPVHPESDNLLKEMIAPSPASQEFNFDVCPALSESSCSNGSTSEGQLARELPEWWKSHETEFNSQALDTSGHSLRRSDRLASAEKHASSPHTSEITVPGREKYNSSFFTESSCAAVIQHGWARAVETDSTFIVFTSGNFERIGIRHRESQTLYLSDLIDVTTCQNPAYGEIHVNLFLAIYQDAISRYEPVPKIYNQKRLRGDIQGTRRSTRIQKTSLSTKHSPATALIPKPDLFTQTNKLNVLILTFSDGLRCSVAPALFIREQQEKAPSNALGIKKRKYRPSQYLSVILTERIGSGAIGVAYKADLQWVHLKSPIHRAVVVKLAFSDHQKERLRHEHSIYQQLAKHSLAGIPSVVGTFQDAAIGGPLALVMTFEGRSLNAARLSASGVLDVSINEQDLFIRLLQAVHAAGVVHGDIRADNLLVDENGGVSIIDFDQASFDTSKDNRRSDLEQFSQLFPRAPLSFPSSEESFATITEEGPRSENARSGIEDT